MEEFLAKTFYGNTVTQWLTAIAIIVAALIVGKTVYWIFKNVFRKLTAKSKSRLDDIILDMIEEPIVVVVTVFGFWAAIGRLTFSERVDELLANAMQAAIILGITWLAARLVNSLIEEYLKPLASKSETDLDDQLLPIFSKGIKFGIWAIGIVVALNNAGQDVGALLAGLGIGGLALAMAAQDTVSNIFGGFTIFTDRPFSLNDFVKIDGHEGYVREIGLRSTRLETFAGTVITIPNSTFSDSAVENVSAEPARRVILDLGLTYDTTPEQIESAMGFLKEILEANENVTDNYAIGFNSFGDFALGIRTVYRIEKGAPIMGTKSDVNLAILHKFNDEGLEMAFPTQTVYTIGAGNG